MLRYCSWSGTIKSGSVATIGPSLGSSEWGESAELFCDKSVADRCKLQDLAAGLEKWEELVGRYERSKTSGTTLTALDVDIKTAALEALVPSELEQHLAMNRARLITYEQFRSEIQAYIETHRSKFALKTVASKMTSNLMEVGSFGKGGKKGKKGNKRKSDGKSVKKEGQHQNQSPNPDKNVVCWHCGQKGHLGAGRIHSLALVELKTKEAKENRRTPQAKEQARWNKENKLQWRSHNSNQLLRALKTWRRLKLLSDHRIWITKVG